MFDDDILSVSSPLPSPSSSPRSTLFLLGAHSTRSLMDGGRAGKRLHPTRPASARPSASSPRLSHSSPSSSPLPNDLHALYATLSPHRTTFNQYDRLRIQQNKILLEEAKDQSRTEDEKIRDIEMRLRLKEGEKRTQDEKFAWELKKNESTIDALVQSNAKYASQLSALLSSAHASEVESRRRHVLEVRQPSPIALARQLASGKKLERTLNSARSARTSLTHTQAQTQSQSQTTIHTPVSPRAPPTLQHSPSTSPDSSPAASPLSTPRSSRPTSRYRRPVFKHGATPHTSTDNNSSHDLANKATNNNTTSSSSGLPPSSVAAPSSSTSQPSDPLHVLHLRKALDTILFACEVKKKKYAELYQEFSRYDKVSSGRDHELSVKRVSAPSAMPALQLQAASARLDKLVHQFNEEVTQKTKLEAIAAHLQRENSLFAIALKNLEMSISKVSLDERTMENLYLHAYDATCAVQQEKESVDKQSKKGKERNKKRLDSRKNTLADMKTFFAQQAAVDKERENEKARLLQQDAPKADAASPQPLVATLALPPPNNTSSTSNTSPPASPSTHSRLHHAFLSLSVLTAQKDLTGIISEYLTQLDKVTQLRQTSHTLTARKQQLLQQLDNERASLEHLKAAQQEQDGAALANLNRSLHTSATQLQIIQDDIDNFQRKNDRIERMISSVKNQVKNLLEVTSSVDSSRVIDASPLDLTHALYARYAVLLSRLPAAHRPAQAHADHAHVDFHQMGQQMFGHNIPTHVNAK